MWPLGHAAVAYLCYTGLCRARSTSPPGERAVLAVLVGSQIPDLIDKPLAWYLGVLPTGRSLGHSLLVIGPLIGLALLVASRYGRPEYGIAAGVGAGSHPLVDALPALWGAADPAILVWPLLPLEPYPDGAPTIMGLLADSLGEPYFLAEFVLAAIAAVVWRQAGYPGLALPRRAARFVRESIAGARAGQ
ncbi:MAG: metal-dependent hydrolase [Euryarchaeota archaeon]|nr:metal-dependent hydrolase [Euryarchaeota archaeon]